MGAISSLSVFKSSRLFFQNFIICLRFYQILFFVIYVLSVVFVKKLFKTYFPPKSNFWTKIEIMVTKQNVSQKKIMGKNYLQSTHYFRHDGLFSIFYIYVLLYMYYRMFNFFWRRLTNVQLFWRRK